MDLTTLARLKQYLPNLGTVSDPMLSALISNASGYITAYCSRSFARVVSTGARLNGNGNTRLRVPNVPIISVASLSVDGVAVAASADALTAGYQYDDTMLYLFGSVFCKGLRNVLVTYTSGFLGTQTSFIPANPGPYTVTPTTGNSNGRDGNVLAIADQGVTNAATGAALVAVGSNPATGQYSFTAPTYTFAATDAGVHVTMNYDYIPGAVEQACIELVGTKVKGRDNLGVQSRGMQGETITYMDKDMPRAVKGMLAPYNSRVPV